MLNSQVKELLSPELIGAANHVNLVSIHSRGRRTKPYHIVWSATYINQDFSPSMSLQTNPCPEGMRPQERIMSCLLSSGTSKSSSVHSLFWRYVLALIGAQLLPLSMGITGVWVNI